MLRDYVISRYQTRKDRRRFRVTRDYNLHGAADVEVDSLNSVPVTFAQACEGLARQFMADARFYQGLRPAGSSGATALAWTMLCNPGLWLLTFHRIAHFCLRQRDVRNPVWWIARVGKSFGTCISALWCRSELAEDCEINGAAYLPNHGYLVCGARRIGAGSVIHERCTFGYTVADGGEGRPDIGRHVWIGPNCIVAGSLTVGDGATVLPGSFLTFSVPPRAVVAGNPARIVRTNFDNSELRRSLAVVSVVPGDSP